MSLLGAPLEPALIQELRKQYPGFAGALPDGARFWTRTELEAFLGSSGEAKPKETAQKSLATCPLLTRARLKLAEAKISGATSEYRSFCRHLLESREVARLPGAAACAEVLRAKVAPEVLRAPVVVEKRREWTARLWNLEFWRRECGGQSWKCRSRSPRFEDDIAGADTFELEATVEEFVEYTKVTHRADRKCCEESAVAYPRLGLEDWRPFTGPLLPLFAVFHFEQSLNCFG